MLTDDMKRTLREVRLGFAATVNADGTPNLSPKGTTLAYDDEHLIFADIRSPRTIENLRRNPAIEINVVDLGTRRGYRFKGRAEIRDEDSLFDWYAQQGHELRGRADRFVVVRVEHAEELTSPAYDWGATEEELLATYIRHYVGVWGARVQGPWPREVYEAHYLADGNPYRGAGHSGDAQTWELGRRPIAEALDRDGTFLDVGCANGLLMESVVAWSPHRIEPYGLDFAPALVAEARRRLPQWADRIHAGDALEWDPPRRFDFVRTELVYVPEDRKREYVERLHGWLEAGGKLLVCGYGDDEVAAPLREWGYEPEVREWRSSSGRRNQLAIARA